jgi:hypothetical protein
MAILNNSNAISTAGGYDINNSLRFRSSASAYLNRTPATASNQKTWTWSAWVKLGAISTNEQLFSAGTNANGVFYDGVAGGFGIDGFYNGTRVQRYTAAVYRDPSAWYHVVAVVDTTQATDTNRLKMYINGVQIALSIAGTGTYPALNSDGVINSVVVHAIGRRQNIPDLYYDGYMADINFIDGSAKTPSDFGETDTTTGVWKPKAYTGTYGTNGFYLKFSDIATTSGSNAGLGKDFSGNTNYWTTNNISVTAGSTYDAMIDSPTLTSATVANFPVLSPLNYRTFSGSVVPTISNANLTVTQASTVASCIGTATMGATASGKYYWEATFVSGSGANNSFLGVVAGQLQNTTANDLGFYSTEYSYKSGNGNKYSNNTQTAYGSSYTSGDVIGFALDLDAGTLTFYKNNTSQGVAFSGLSASETYFPAFDTYYNNTFAYNFGQRPFAYTPPTGFVALNTYNLPDSTIKKGSTVMDAYIYTGDGNSTRTITLPIVADFVWSKNRTTANDHVLIDTVRGGTSPVKALFSNLTVAEITTIAGWGGYGYPDSLSGTSYAVVKGTQATSYTNKLNDSYVNWIWQAGQGSTSSNTSGSITSTVSVNATAGFSVVTYTGNATNNATIGHGLGVAPKMVITKNRATAGTYWYVYHSSLAATYNLYLNTTDAQQPDNVIRSTSATTFTVSSSSAANGTSMVAYCWAEIAGFSKFGSYTGNGSTDGPFIFTGFRPKFIMRKQITDNGDVGGWIMFDTSRDTYNVATRRLLANSSNAEATPGNNIDILSNGWKERNSDGYSNASGQTYIYMAFAENPFKNALAR